VPLSPVQQVHFRRRGRRDEHSSLLIREHWDIATSSFARHLLEVVILKAQHPGAAVFAMRPRRAKDVVNLAHQRLQIRRQLFVKTCADPRSLRAYCYALREDRQERLLHRRYRCNSALAK
jgi:hypothetical protein